MKLSGNVYRTPAGALLLATSAAPSFVCFDLMCSVDMAVQKMQQARWLDEAQKVLSAKQGSGVLLEKVQELIQSSKQHTPHPGKWVGPCSWPCLSFKVEKARKT